MKHIKNKYILSSFAIVIGVLILWQLFQPKTKKVSKKKKVPLVSISKVKKGDISENIELTGEVVVTNRVTIKTTVTGIVSYCPWREGDIVKSAGELLIKIDRPLLIAEMEAKKASLEVSKAKLADLKSGTRPEEILRAKYDVARLKECTSSTKIDLNRKEKLNEKGIVSQATVETAKVDYIKCNNDLKAAEERLKILTKGATKTEIAVLEAQVQEAAAELKILQAKVSECKIKAPFAGIITKVFVRKGDLVRESRDDVTLLEMIDPKSMIVLFHVPEQYATLVKKIPSVSISIDSLTGKFKKAKILRVFPEVDEITHTVAVEAQLETKEISPGMFVRVKLPVHSAKNALIVPDTALLGTEDNYYVFVFRDGIAEKRKVMRGIESGVNVQILKGLAIGDSIVTDGNTSLKSGIKVRIKKKSPGKPVGKKEKRI